MIDPNSLPLPNETDSEPPLQYQLTGEEVERIWTLTGQELSKCQRELLPALRHWLGRKRNNALASYLVGKSVGILDSTQIGDLTADTLVKFRPQVNGVAALHLLGKVIDNGNEQAIFSLCPPPIPVLAPRQASPFSKMSGHALDIGPNLRTLLARSIQSPAPLSRARMPPTKVAQFTLGQCLVASIVHGGLIHSNSLEALVHRLLDGEPLLDCVGNRVFVEHSLNWQRQADAEFRRWFPDELSAVLLMNIAPDVVRLAVQSSATPEVVSFKKSIWSCIRTFMQYAASHREKYPKSLPSLLDATRLDFETRLPIALIGYASRRFVSHSLKPHVWRRLHGVILPQAPALPVKDIGKIAPPGTGLLNDVKDTDEPEPRWLRMLREALRGNDREAIVLRIDALLDSSAPGFQPGGLGNLFAAYARRSLLVCNDNKVRLSVGTACAYVISTAKRLGGLVGPDDLLDWGSVEWTALYEEALVDAENEKGRRRKLVRTLRDFQRYLGLDHGVEKIDEAEVFGSADGLVSVDANIISHDEFCRIRERFTQDVANEIHPDLATIAWLTFTLAYRCGLRRMEALKLELADVLIEAPAELLVRPTTSRRLKTKSSTRKIPLYALLDAEELGRLRGWLEKRREMERAHPYSVFLFSLPQLNYFFVPQDTMFKLLHRVMREVTGDSTLRFHHLRHTFATRTFIALMSSNAVNQKSLVAALPGFTSVLENASEFRKRLYGNTRMTRRDIWAISSLLGHSGPDISVQHYVHLFDLALADQLSQPEIAPSTSVVIAASGKSAAQAYRHRNECGLQNWIASMWRKRHPEFHERNSKSASTVYGHADRASSTDQSLQADSIYRIWRLLFLHEARGLPVSELAKRYGIGPKRIERYLSTARLLHGMTMSRSGKNYRHRFMSWVPDKRHPDNILRIICPTKPHEHRDRRLIETLVPKLREATQCDKALTTRVLNYFALNARPNFAGLIFTDPDNPQPARDFLRLLGMLGITGQNLRYISFDVTSKRSKWPAVWRRALALRASEAFDKVAPPNGRRDWPCPWLGIEPVFLDEAAAMTGSAAVRFCLIMALIATGNLSATAA